MKNKNKKKKDNNMRDILRLLSKSRRENLFVLRKRKNKKEKDKI